MTAAEVEAMGNGIMLDVARDAINECVLAKREGLDEGVGRLQQDRARTGRR